MSIAICAGSFDPFTVGHLDIVRRGAAKFDIMYVSICWNPGKQGERFSLEDRLTLIRDAVKDLDNVRVTSFSGLLVDYCREIGADCIVRGIRNGSDVEYERMLESVNHRLDSRLETVYLLARPELAYISSSLVWQLMNLNISIDGLVPNAEHIIFTKGKKQNGK